MTDTIEQLRPYGPGMPDGQKPWTPWENDQFAALGRRSIRGEPTFPEQFTPHPRTVDLGHRATERVATLPQRGVLEEVFVGMAATAVGAFACLGPGVEADRLAVQRRVHELAA